MVALLIVLALLSAGTSAAAPSRSELAAATLDLRADLRLVSTPEPCPTGGGRRFLLATYDLRPVPGIGASGRDVQVAPRRRAADVW
jgi:hypothetical protein